MSAFKSARDAVLQARHKFPKTGGWKTVDQVARELRVATKRVSTVLGPCLRGPRRTVERKDFRVWCPKKRAIVRASGYRVIRRK